HSECFLHHKQARCSTSTVLSMSACHGQIDNSKLTNLFNLGFRRGANDRFAIGLNSCCEASPPLNQPPLAPPPPSECNRAESKIWKDGYAMGFQIGASDAELARVEIPGACGMISGLGEEILEMIGLLRPEDEDKENL